MYLQLPIVTSTALLSSHPAACSTGKQMEYTIDKFIECALDQ